MGGVEGKAGMTLAIIGKARQVAKSEQSFYDLVWTMGTVNIDADMYLCLHGEHSKHPERDWTWADSYLRDVAQYYSRFPIVNSVCVLLAFLAYEVEVDKNVGITRVDILASPLIATKEMKEEKPAVAFWVGYLRAIGIEVNWEGGFKRALPYMWEDHGHKDFTGVIV